jgi:transposase InsO family protein
MSIISRRLSSFPAPRKHFSTREQGPAGPVAGWIDEYNTVRRHSTDGMLSPVEFERRQEHPA